MTNTQLAKTMLSGVAMMLASLTGPGAWAVSRGVYPHLPAESATGFAVATAVALAIAIGAWVFIKEPKNN